MLAQHYVNIVLKEIVVINFIPIQERREGVKVAKNVMFHLERSAICFCFCLFCSVLSEKAEITSQGAYHHHHFVALTSQCIFLFHLTKKGIVDKIKKDHCIYTTHIHIYFMLNCHPFNYFYYFWNSIL